MGAAAEVRGSSLRSATSRIAAGRVGSFGNGIREFSQELSDEWMDVNDGLGEAAGRLKHFLHVSGNLEPTPGLHELAARIN